MPHEIDDQELRRLLGDYHSDVFEVGFPARCDLQALAEPLAQAFLDLRERVEEYEENMRLYITDLCMGNEHQAVDWVKVFSELLPAPTNED